jgi:uncharacterized repeat protein (TIGR01451 family)
MAKGEVMKRRVLRLALVTALIATLGTAFAAAASAGTVLILSTSVTGGAASYEALAATAAGHTVEVATPAQWAAKTAADFATYDALILGDPTCTGGFGDSSSIAAAEANRTTWSPTIDGNVVVIGTDEVFHNFQGGNQLTNSAVKFAADAAGKTGLMVSLSCYYHEFFGVTHNVPVLDQFGTFTTVGVECYNDAHIVATHPALFGLTDAQLSNWSCSVHEAFAAYPETGSNAFLPLAIARNISGPYSKNFPDGSFGVPYILARGEGLVLISNITLTPAAAVNDVGTSHTVTATVKENDAPVAGKLVTFSVTSGPHMGTTGTDTTDSNGQATFTYTGTAAGTDTIVASYVDSSGETKTSAPVTKTWIVRDADIAVQKTGPAYAQSGGTITYTVTVNNLGPANATNVTVTDPLPAGLTLVSATPSQGSCAGTVTCNLGSISTGGSATITIVATVTAASGSTVCNKATGTADQPDPVSGNNSSTTCALIYAGSAGGMFVIGNLNAAVGTSVTFWGAQWWKLNSLSGGAAPAAFKGFEDTPAAPGCGTNWTTDPGNSTPPPAGPLPPYMAVIVSSSISKSGSTISGDTQHIVIVQTNPGYAPNPGHAGTGTVVAQIC